MTLMAYIKIDGLDYIHGNGIVHCDFKPENVVIGTDGLAKICDFGTAHNIDQNYELRIGSISFLPPELATSEVLVSYVMLFSILEISFHHVWRDLMSLCTGVS